MAVQRGGRRDHGGDQSLGLPCGFEGTSASTTPPTATTFTQRPASARWASPSGAIMACAATSLRRVLRSLCSRNTEGEFGEACQKGAWAASRGGRPPFERKRAALVTLLVQLVQRVPSRRRTT